MVMVKIEGRWISTAAILTIRDTKGGGSIIVWSKTAYDSHFPNTTADQLAAILNRAERDLLVAALNPDALATFQRLSQLEDQTELLIAELAAIKDLK